MRIAFFGANSQIAKDLILAMAAQGEHELALFARRPHAVDQWLSSEGLYGRFPSSDFGAFGDDLHFDCVINFVGVGNPARAAAMGASIFDVTLNYDDLALSYVHAHPGCKYLFLSSGAVFGSSFEQPVDANSRAVIPINGLQQQDWYGVAKLHAECRHRSLAQLPIIDLRVFNYFSHTQDISDRFLITDIVRAIRDQSVMLTSPAQIVRDYVHPSDLYALFVALLNAPATNSVVDCYSRAPVEKFALLEAMKTTFGLRYEIAALDAGVNATGSKPHYYSLNRRAADFGYRPTLGSLEGVLRESRKMLGRLGA